MVNRGDKLDIAASDWNAVLEHLKQCGDGRICNAPAAAVGADELLIYNAGTRSISPFMMVRINDVLRPEAAGTADFLLGQKVFCAQMYWDIEYKFSDTVAVAKQEIAPGGVGRASIAPVAACFVNFSNNAPLDAPAVTPHGNGALPSDAGLKIIAADRTRGYNKWAIVDLREKIGFAPDTFFKLSRYTEAVESGGVQVVVSGLEITNPGRILAFGSEFAASGGRIAASGGGSIYMEIDYINSGGAVRYVTSPSVNSALHPAVKLGDYSDVRLEQKFNSYESPYVIHPRGYAPLCVPITSGGSAAVLIKEGRTDLPGSGFVIPSAVIAEAALSSGRRLFAVASYNSATSQYSASWQVGDVAPVGAYIELGTVGNVENKVVRFSEEYII